jgi:hypothetical protein
LEFSRPFLIFFRRCKCKTLLPLNYQIHSIMKALQRFFFFFTTVLALSSCASFENLTDDRTRAEDDEMYWNGKELFYENSLVTNVSGGGDDYYDPNSATRSNSVSGGTNPRAAFNPISGWQLSYGLNAFSNYSNGYGMGFGSYSPYNSYGGFGNYGNNSFGYNPYGYNSYGYSPYSSYNGYGGYGYNPYGYGMGGLGWGGYGSGWLGNGWSGNGGGWGGHAGSGEATNVTHHHRRPASVGSGNSSTYHRGVLQKSLVQPIAETARTPQAVAPVRGNTNGNYNNPTYSSPSRSTPAYTQPSNSGPSRPATTSPSSPSRPAPTHSTPSHSAPSPSRSTPTHSTPSHSTPTHSTPSRSAPTHSSPSHSAPSRTSSPGKRP